MERRLSLEIQTATGINQDLVVEDHRRQQLPAEHRAKISEANKGRKFSAEHRAKLSEAMKGENNPNYGKKHSAETRAKMSEAKKGENNPNYGKKHSAEARGKISAALKGENHPNYGKKHSAETRAKISEAKKGEKNSEWDKNIEQVRQAVTRVVEGSYMSQASLDVGFGKSWLRNWRGRHPQRYSIFFIEAAKKLEKQQAKEKLGALALDIIRD